MLRRFCGGLIAIQLKQTNSFSTALIQKPPGFWNDEKNVNEFLNNLKEKLNLTTFKSWNSLSQKQIRENGGSTLLNKYSMYQIKCLGFPEEKELITNQNLKLKKPSKYWDDKKNVQTFLLHVKEKYNLKNEKDWNLISKKDIKALYGGNTLLNKYSLFELKLLGFPDGNFNSVKNSGFWNDENNVKQFLKQLKVKLNLNTPNDWNLLSQKDIQANGGSSLLQNYSLYKLKCIGCPEGKNFFKKPKLSKPSGYWNNEENVKQFLKNLENKYNLKSLDDWENITQKDIRLNGGNRLLSKYSLFELKCLGFPSGKDLFKKPKLSKPAGYWNNEENIKHFLNSLKLKFNFNSVHDWNSLSLSHIDSVNGRGLLQKYSIYELKCLACPEGKDFFINKFKKSKPSGYWDNIENVKLFLSSLEKKLHIKSPEDWNLLSQKDIKINGGSRLLDKYSLYELKCIAYPDNISIFNPPQRSSQYWENEENIHEFINELKQKFSLQNNEDWERLSKKQIQAIGGSGLARKYSLDKIAKFEDFDTENSNRKNTRLKRSSQRWLFIQIQKLFPGEEIIEDYFHPKISRENGFAVQFDIFILNRNIAVEYHGSHHFEDIPSGFAPLEMYKNRDKEKQNLCKKYNIHLIIIPYWWDNKLNSLKDYFSNIEPTFKTL